MSKDQIKKMNQYRNDYFLLSWTLTGQILDMMSWDIRKMADKANERLTELFFPEFYKHCINREFHITETNIFPNIIYTDNINSGYAAFIAMCVNFMLKKTN